MSLKRLLPGWGLLIVSAAAACEASHGDSPGSAEAGASGAEASGANGGEAGNGGGGNAGGTDAGTAGQAGNGCILDDAAGADGEAARPGCLTVTVPTLPFLIERLPDPGENVCTSSGGCAIGPWLMVFRSLPDGDLEGALVSTQDSLWPADHEREAAAFRLHSEDGVYRLSDRTKATLASYTYKTSFGIARVPGVCLAAPGVAFGIDRDVREGNAFRFFDVDGDGVADTLTLSGIGVGLGVRGGDYSSDCSDEPLPLQTQGRVVDTVIDLHAAGDVLRPELLVDGGFLEQGSARVRVSPSRWVDAQPLTLSGFTYGFRANVVIQPGAPLLWQIEGADILGRQIGGDVSVGEAEPWLKVSDPTFEAFESGETWGTGTASIEERCNPSDTDVAPPLPAISGVRSLVIGEYRDRFRFTRTAEQTQLSFVAFGQVGVELTMVGTESEEPFRQAPTVTDADCEQYAAFCAKVPPGTLKHYAVALPAGDSDVLLRLTNEDGRDWSTGAGTDLCVDDLELQ